MWVSIRTLNAPAIAPGFRLSEESIAFGPLATRFRASSPDYGKNKLQPLTMENPAVSVNIVLVHLGVFSNFAFG